MIIEGAADPGGRIAGTVKIKNVADNGGLIRLNGIAAIRAAGVAEDAGAVIQAAVGIVHHASGDLLRQLAGLPLCGGLQHTFQENTGGTFRNWFHCINDMDTEPAELALIDRGIFTVASEAVHLPGNNGIK